MSMPAALMPSPVMACLIAAGVCLPPAEDHRRDGENQDDDDDCKHGVVLRVFRLWLDGSSVFPVHFVPIGLEGERLLLDHPKAE